MVKDNGEESLPEVEDENVEWSDEPPADVPDPPASPDAIVVEETEDEMVTYIRQPNGKLVPYKPGMDNR